jgi:tRNA/rRNA methyltransferase
MTDTAQAGGEPPVAGGFTSTRFVLVEPSHPGNVGAAARALKTMGFARLVLVRPRVSHVHEHPEACAMASGATDVLANAHVAESLEDALSGVHWSLALSARPREYGPPMLMPRVAAERAHVIVGEGAQEVALVFGNERAGLSNADVDRCSAIVHIPANPAYSSLNLAQAVQVLAYELRMAFQCGSGGLISVRPAGARSRALPGGAQGDAPGGLEAAGDTQEDAAGRASSGMAGVAPQDGGASPLAASDDVERMFVHLENALISLDFLDPANPKKLMPRLRRLFARASLEREEVAILRGIAKHILLKGKRPIS